MMGKMASGSGSAGLDLLTRSKSGAIRITGPDGRFGRISGTVRLECDGSVTGTVVVGVVKGGQK